MLDEVSPVVVLGNFPEHLAQGVPAKFPGERCLVVLAKKFVKELAVSVIQSKEFVKAF